MIKIPETVQMTALDNLFNLCIAKKDVINNLLEEEGAEDSVVEFNTVLDSYVNMERKKAKRTLGDAKRSKRIQKSVRDKKTV